MPITYVRGDATLPRGGNIVHICNNAGGWGAGFVLALSARFPEPEKAYREWAARKTHPRSGPFALGSVQFVSVDATPRLWVANMIAQDGYGGSKGIPLRYDALETCLTKVGSDVRVTGGDIHMPRIGCGLAGGKWEMVEPIIQRTLQGIQVFVYDP